MYQKNITKRISTEVLILTNLQVAATLRDEGQETNSAGFLHLELPVIRKDRPRLCYCILKCKYIIRALQQGKILTLHNA